METDQTNEGGPMREERRLEPTGLAGDDLRADLEAAIGARSELGPSMEDHVLDVFLERLERKIDLRVDQVLQRTETRDRPATTGGGSHFGAVVAPSLALSIPLVAIAGGIAGGLGIAAVMGAVLAINLMYFIYEMTSRRRW